MTASPTGKPVRGFPVEWREAAVFGALWGAVEVTLGTFLHTIRAPMIGVIMAAIAVGLLTASMMLIRRSWFPLRAALICAGLRSMIPGGGVIWGPFVGIVGQGVIVSLAFLILRKPLLAGPVAGALATIVAVLQGLIGQVVSYGKGLVEIYMTLLNKASDLLHVGQENGLVVLVLFFALVGLIGAAGGIAGWNLGRRALQRERVTSA